MVAIPSASHRGAEWSAQGIGGGSGSAPVGALSCCPTLGTHGSTVRGTPSFLRALSGATLRAPRFPRALPGALPGAFQKFSQSDKKRAMFPLPYYLEKVLRDTGNISHWATPPPRDTYI